MLLGLPASPVTVKQGCDLARVGQQVLLRHRWKGGRTTEKSGAASPEDTQMGVETGKAPAGPTNSATAFCQPQM